MTRSTDFSTTVKRGIRSAQPDLVVHVDRDADGSAGPRIGLVVAKSVGSAVDRHRVSRKLRHVARGVIDDLDPAERIVIRALPGSRLALSGRLEQQFRAGLERSHRLREARR